MIASGGKNGISMAITIPAGTQSAPFTDYIYIENLTAKEAFALIGQLRQALFDWSSANGGAKIDEGSLH